MEALRAKLTEALASAAAVYEANGRQPWDGGRYDGLRQALQLIDEAS